MTDQPQQPQGEAAQQPYGQPGQPGQPGQQESKFGTAAYNPGAVGQELTEPMAWGRLKMLTLVSLAINVVSGLVGLFVAFNEDLVRDQVRAQLEAQGLAASEEMIDQSVQLGMAFGIGTVAVTLVIGIILYLVVFFGLRRVKNWARILGTVFAVLGALYTIWGLATIGATMAASPAVGIITLVLGVLFVVVNVWWLVTAFSKDSNAYLRARA